MSFSYGKNLRLTLFGQSHGEAVGCVIEGLPVGMKIDEEKIEEFMKQRRAKNSAFSTGRKEEDKAIIYSGLFRGLTCESPLCAVFENKDVGDEIYEKIKDTPRPSHADYPSYVKYKGFNDYRGAGSFSARLTAPLTFAGAIANQILEERGIYTACHVYQVGKIKDTPLENAPWEEAALLGKKTFPVLNDNAGEKMQEYIKEIREEGDSVGAVVEGCIYNLPTGLGEPPFDGLENALARALFAIPAMKGLEFGLGFEGALMKGSSFNDEYYYENKKIKTKTNNNGGILGGLATSMPLTFKAAFKPTPSISLTQDTINLKTKENTKIKIQGRHDACVGIRAVSVVRAVSAFVAADFLLGEGNEH